MSRQSVSESGEHAPTITRTRGAETFTVAHPWPGIFVTLVISDRGGDVLGRVRLTPGQADDLAQALRNHGRRAHEMQAIARQGYQDD